MINGLSSMGLKGEEIVRVRIVMRKIRMSHSSSSNGRRKDHRGWLAT